jgi:DNA-binding response OmpR family regulator
MKILIVEDEYELTNSIISYLQAEGYLCERALNYSDSLWKMSAYQYDCFIVDIGLPDGSGLNLVQEIKNSKLDAGVIIISARKSLEDKVKGLDIGADDYLTKPFHLSELNARIKSILRRRKLGGSKDININEIRIIPDVMEVYVNNNLVNLTKKEYDLLFYFISNKNKILTKESIAEHLWGDYADTADSYDFIYTHIKNLRKKLVNEGSSDYIQTVNRMGYKFKVSETN